MPFLSDLINGIVPDMGIPPLLPTSASPPTEASGIPPPLPPPSSRIPTLSPTTPPQPSRAEMQDMIEKLREKNREHEAVKQSQYALLHDYTKEIEMLKNECRRLAASRRREMPSEIFSRMEQSNSVLESGNLVLEEKIKALVKEKESLLAENAEMKRGLDSLRDEKEELSSTIDYVEETVVDLKQKFMLQEEINGNQQQTIQRQKAHHEQVMAERRKVCAELQKANESMTKGLSNEKAEHAKKVKTLKAKEALIDNLNENIRWQEKATREHMIVIEGLARQNFGLEQTMKGLEEQVSAQANHITHSDRKIIELHDKLEDQVTANNDLVASRERLDKQLAAEVKNRSHFDKVTESLQSNIRQRILVEEDRNLLVFFLQDQIRCQLQDHEEKDRVVEELKGQVATHLSTIQKLMRANEELRKELHVLKWEEEVEEKSGGDCSEGSDDVGSDDGNVESSEDSDDKSDGDARFQKEYGRQMKEAEKSDDGWSVMSPGSIQGDAEEGDHSLADLGSQADAQDMDTKSAEPAELEENEAE